MIATDKRRASIQKGTSSSPPLNNLGVKKENIAAIIIGSAGGNDASGNPNIADDNSSFNKSVREVFKTLKDYQDSGILVLFIGLPYGMQDGNPRRAKKREAMDENFKKQAAAVGFTNYVSVMAETKKIKLAEKAAGYSMSPLFGVHYKRSPWKEQYADLIESILPFR